MHLKHQQIGVVAAAMALSMGVPMPSFDNSSPYIRRKPPKGVTTAERERRKAKKAQAKASRRRNRR